MHSSQHCATQTLSKKDLFGAKVGRPSADVGIFTIWVRPALGTAVTQGHFGGSTEESSQYCSMF